MVSEPLKQRYEIPPGKGKIGNFSHPESSKNSCCLLFEARGVADPSPGVTTLAPVPDRRGVLIIAAAAPEPRGVAARARSMSGGAVADVEVCASFRRGCRALPVQMKTFLGTEGLAQGAARKLLPWTTS